jgi:hypothetical protein
VSSLFSITTVTDKGLLRRKPGAGTHLPAYVAKNDMAVGVSERLSGESLFCISLCVFSARESEVLLIDGGDDLFLLLPLGEKSNDRHQNP